MAARPINSRTVLNKPIASLQNSVGSRTLGSRSTPARTVKRRTAIAKIATAITIQALFVPVMRINRIASSAAITWKAKESATMKMNPTYMLNMGG